MELSMKTGNKERDENTIAADIGTAGIHVFVDKGFYERLAQIKEHFSEYMTEEEIEALDLTEKRQAMMKMAMKKLEFVWYQLAFGKVKENPKLIKATAAARRIILRVESSLESDASDEQVLPICRERLSQLDPLILFTFDSQNTTINKAFTVQGPMQPQMQMPTMTPVQQLDSVSEKPQRGGREYAGRNP